MDCILCGKCKKSCPTYTIFREELFSPRGKMALYQDEIDKDSVDFKCLLCGNCITACPFDIDVPITFLFNNKLDEVTENSGKNIIVDTLFFDPEKVTKAVSQSTVKFDDSIVIEDGVTALYQQNEYSEIEKFREFLEHNSRNSLYFTERSSLDLAKRAGHCFSYALIDTLSIEYQKTASNLNRYYSLFSKEQFDQLLITFPNGCDVEISDVAFNFYNPNRKFYLDLF